MWFGLVSLRVEGVSVSLGLKNHMALVYPQERDDVEMSEEELLMLFSSDVQRRGPPKFSGSDGAPRYPWCVPGSQRQGRINTVGRYGMQSKGRRSRLTEDLCVADHSDNMQSG